MSRKNRQGRLRAALGVLSPAQKSPALMAAPAVRAAAAPAASAPAPFSHFVRHDYDANGELRSK